MTLPRLRASRTHARTRRIVSGRLRHLLLSAAAGLLVVASGASPAAAQGAKHDPPAESASSKILDRAPALRDAIEARRRANQAANASQERIAALSDKTDELYAKASAARRQLDALLSYNQRMREAVSGQEKDLASLAKQLEQIDKVVRSVTPMMYRMIDALESFIALDVPFLTQERAERVADLRKMMKLPGIAASVKYRRIMEAYQNEIEYGRTIEAYRAPLRRGGDERTVDFLRFGRVALLYLTLDGTEAGAWDARTRSWKTLPSAFVPEVRRGLEISRKQIPPDLVELPLPPPEDDATRLAGGG